MSGMLAVEPLLVERLQAALGGMGVRVFRAADLSGVAQASQAAPAVHVVPDGFDIREERGLVEISERWLTVIVVRNVRSAKSGEDARQDAGPILDAAFAALLGWIPVETVKPLLPSTPPRPVFNAGMGYFPLAWQVRLRKINLPCIA